MPENITGIEALYKKYSGEFLTSVKADDFFAFVMSAIQAGKSNFSFYEKYIERNIDIKWVEAIEKSIIPIDTIIRNPNRFIKNEEEIVPIEMARRISNESIRHLAQHTNMIAKVEGDEVTPQRILNVVKEESFETYENRFLYTLLKKIEYFLDKRLQELLKGINTNDEFEMKFNGECDIGHDKLSYDVNISYITPHKEVGFDELLLTADTSRLSAMERIERLRKIIYSFSEAPLIKSLSGCALVRPPLNMTNVLTKNQNFIKAVDLWVFIDTYNSTGYTMDFVERETVPSGEFVNDLFSTVALQYTVTKANSGSLSELGDYSERYEHVRPNIVRRDVDKLLEDYDLEIDEVRKVFLERVEKKKIIKKIRHNQYKEIVQRAIDFETEKMALEDKARIAEAERRRKAEELERQREEKRIAREKLLKKAKEEKAKRLKEKEKAKEKARIASEKAKEKARIAKEKAKARAIEEKLKEKEKADKEKQRAKDKEKAVKEKQRAKDKEKAQREKQRAKDKEKADKEKQRAKDKEKAQREKQKAKEKAQREKQKAKEKIAREKEKLKSKRKK